MSKKRESIFIATLFKKELIVYNETNLNLLSAKTRFRLKRHMNWDRRRSKITYGSNLLNPLNRLITKRFKQN